MIFFDLTVVVLMLLFDCMKTPANLAFFDVFNQSLQITQDNTTTLYIYSMYELSFNPSKISFEHYLNDKHDELFRRIFIRDVQNNQQLFMYNPEEENEPLFMYNPGEPHTPIYYYNPEEILGLLDFEVVVPIGFVYDESLLIDHIEKFRLPGMSYQIVEE